MPKQRATLPTASVPYLLPEHTAAYQKFDNVSPFRYVLDAAKVTDEGLTFSVDGTRFAPG
ncbi:MAG: hypothetical protein ACOYOU_15725 [Kiritimatiellia bacterium]